RTAEGAARLGFGLRGDNVELNQVLAFLPGLAENVEGTGSLRISGTMADNLRATGDVRVASARLFRVPLADLRAPAELAYSPGGTGTLRVRSWTARLAGGHLRGNLSFRIGSDRSYQGDLTLAQVDLEPITRVATESPRPASGRVSGRITWSGRDPAQPQTLRGRIELDLDDASLFELPVFREMNRFLGAAQGGLFEDGDLVATVANRQIAIELLTLEGRIAQMYVAGTIGFNSELDLAALVNTNQIIPQRGTALLALIPGYGTAAAGTLFIIQRIAQFLSNRLLKLHVTGTIRNPVVAIDPSIDVPQPAVGFFSRVLGVPVNSQR
ncbi:MAG TPA: AsmA-like C-terminal region-containing protein, partial [Isosphaeraceae bacterium]